LVYSPNCETENAIAIKCWTVTPVKHRASCDMPDFWGVEIFKCLKCKFKFKAIVDTTTKPM